MSDSTENIQPAIPVNKFMPFSLEALVGKTLEERYQIEELIGMGAMGAVFRARHLRLRRTVAVKVPRPELCSRPGFLGRFEREALTMAKLVQENIVQVFDVCIYEETEKPSFIAMEYIEGVELEQYLFAQDNKLTISAVVDLFYQIARGLDAAHERGIIHRDIKPKNICVTLPQHVAKIMDFGVAKLEMEDVYETVQESAIGTPAYMAPEQVTGDAITPAADIYALGVTIYHILTRRLPFDAQSASNMLFAQVSTPPIPAHTRNPSLPIKVHQALSLALAKSPADRPKTAKALVRAIHQSLQPFENLGFSELFSGKLNPVKASQSEAQAKAAKIMDAISESHADELDEDGNYKDDVEAKLSVTQRLKARIAEGDRNRQMLVLGIVAAILVVVGGVGAMISSARKSTLAERRSRNQSMALVSDSGDSPIAIDTPEQTPEAVETPADAPRTAPEATPSTPAENSTFQISPETGAMVEVASNATSISDAPPMQTSGTLISSAPAATTDVAIEAVPDEPSDSLPPPPPPTMIVSPPEPTPIPTKPEIVASVPQVTASADSVSYTKLDSARWDPKKYPTEPVAWKREQTRRAIEKFLGDQIEAPVYHGLFDPMENALAATGGKTAEELLAKLRELYEANDEVSLSLKIVQGAKYWEDRAELSLEIKVTGRPKGYPDPTFRKTLLRYSESVPIRVQKSGEEEWQLLSFNNH